MHAPKAARLRRGKGGIQWRHQERGCREVRHGREKLNQSRGRAGRPSQATRGGCHSHLAKAEPRQGQKRQLSEAPRPLSPIHPVGLTTVGSDCQKKPQLNECGQQEGTPLSLTPPQSPFLNLYTLLKISTRLTLDPDSSCRDYLSTA